MAETIEDMDKEIELKDKKFILAAKKGISNEQSIQQKWKMKFNWQFRLIKRINKTLKIIEKVFF